MTPKIKEKKGKNKRKYDLRYMRLHDNKYIDVTKKEKDRQIKLK